jgi:glutaredoxin-like protein NrdH
MTVSTLDLNNHAHGVQARDGVAVVLYGKPFGCVQCDATKRKLNKHNIHYTEVDVTQDETALNFIKGLGYSAAPVVYVSTIDGDVHWTQFDVNKIAEHITERPDAA